MRKLTPQKVRQRKAILRQPVRHIKIEEKMTIAKMVEAMAGMSIQARNLGQCAEVLKNIYADKKRPTVFLGLAGPLIAAGLRKVIRDLIVKGAVDVLVSTGAIIYQDIYAALGFEHFKGTPQADDDTLYDLKIDRIYDTYLDETKVWQADRFCAMVADAMAPGNYSSRAYLEAVADQLKDEESILFQCRKLGIPVFVPALNDSSIGIGLTEHRVRCRRDKREGIAIDAIQDNEEIVQIVVKSPKTAAFYVAGGVPKNYINDSIVMGYLYGLERGHDYALQITTAVTADGGLSSSTLKEACSWGKIDKKACSAMAWVEPSVSLPLLAGYIFGKKLTARRKMLELKWEGAALLSLTPNRVGLVPPSPSCLPVYPPKEGRQAGRGESGFNLVRGEEYA
ncbi:MAG: deoxyhypusine synthase family protein [Candidatus Margulisbacteria bacterium]|nr:deoxyhypusine synthase family protein [Candidatus Margulisiibacteriota bacterium]